MSWLFSILHLEQWTELQASYLQVKEKPFLHNYLHVYLTGMPQKRKREASKRIRIREHETETSGESKSVRQYGRRKRGPLFICPKGKNHSTPWALQDLWSNRKSPRAHGPNCSDHPPHAHTLPLWIQQNKHIILNEIPRFVFSLISSVWDGWCKIGNRREPENRTERGGKRKNPPLSVFPYRERERVMQSWLAQDQQQQKHLDNRTQ